VSGYWAILAFWAVTALPGLYFGWQYGDGEITLLDLSSWPSFATSALVVAWLAYPAWGYWFFSRRAARHRVNVRFGTEADLQAGGSRSSVLQHGNDCPRKDGW
jgi:hypothetical protein